MSTFLQEVQQLNVTPKSVCRTRHFIDSQDLEELKKQGKEPITVEALDLAFTLNTLKSVHKALVNRGYPYAEHGLRSHLRKDCVCYRDGEKR